MKIHATLEVITATGATSHDIDECKVTAIMDAIDRGEVMQPVLVVMGIDLVLDGNHRMQAAYRNEYDNHLFAYTIEPGDFDELIIEEFGGEVPSRLNELDEYILVDGKPCQERDES